jgi:sodium transport system permease protein
MVGIEQIFDEMSMLQQFLFIAFTPGICEELLFRGLAFRPIEKKLGPKKAILITALLFGIMHLDIVRLLPTVLLGLVMGTVAYASGSIFPVMLLHICNNFFAAFGLADLDVSMGLLVIVGISGLSLGGILIKKSFDREQKEDYNRSVK